MSEDLFARLNAIGEIIGGKSGTYEPPTFDLGGEEGHEGHADAGGRMNAPSPTGFTGGTSARATSDSKGPSPGATSLMNHLLEDFAGGSNMGIYNYRNVRGGTGLSLHAEGRAGDFGVPVVAGGHPLGHQVAAYLVANADRFGVQEIIFANQSWNRRTRRWQPYGGPGKSPHLDHVHWGLTPEAAAMANLAEGGTKAGGLGAAAGGVKAGIKGDLFSRMKGVEDIIGGKRTARDVDKEREGTHGNLSKDMAARFAAARAGKSSPAAATASASTATLAAGSKGELQAYAISQFGNFGWDQSQADALIQLITRESGWNPNAQNPTSTAYGLFQLLNSTWAGVGATKTADPQAQIQAGLTYIKNRYGSPQAAWAFWQKNHWY